MTRPAGKPTNPSSRQLMVVLEAVSKTFALHTQGGLRLPAIGGVSLAVHAGECVAVNGPSGAGKSTLLRLIYGNYRGQCGSIRVQCRGKWVELVGADPRVVIDLRQHTIGYVSQFLRAVPRVAAIDVVAEPLIALGTAKEAARARAEAILHRLNLPERLWGLSPVTFSGGEQQRTNVARTFIVDYPVLLLDEPTASLDAANRQVVLHLLHEARARGAAILGIFHDRGVREAIADRIHELAPYEAAA